MFGTQTQQQQQQQQQQHQNTVSQKSYPLQTNMHLHRI